MTRGKKARRFFTVLWVGGVLGLLAWGGSDLAIRKMAAGRVYGPADIASMPETRAAVVLGCSRTFPSGADNLYFTRRIAAAAELYKAGKLKCLVVSGDNHVKGYDEPTDMKEALVAAGVPADRIVCDYAGFRTLDSIVRAKEIFGLDRFIIVSQPAHVRRAVFLARSLGADASGYAAADVIGCNFLKTTIREQFAKINAVLDVVIHRQPKYLGSKEVLPDA
ncbi:MAG: vancomycin high temperature exclusion protein [Kiritimatiellia bacterium]